GLTVLKEMVQAGFRIPTVMISGEGEIPDVVQAIKLGAYDYLKKPVDPTHMRVMLGNMLQHVSISRENERLRQRLIEAGQLGALVGNSRAMKNVMALVRQVAPTSTSVIIRGESGTGKELVARTIHELSPRHDGPYV